jgi:thiol-disulfide isomerase/thioredoxin
MVFNGSCSKEIKAKALKKNAEPEINNNQVPVEEIKLGLFHCFIDYISVIPNEDIREVLISNQFLQMYETTDVNYPADSLLSIISNPLIQERFLMQYENISSLKNINSRIEIPTQNEGEILFENIKKMYPGYVICFNFWGTWCKPCYDHLKELEANKNNLKAGKVVNVYLCCQSPEKIWEKRIEELHVEGVHYLLNNEQYVFFSERFGIEGFPGTVLVNRNGEISIDHTNNIKALINKINILANQ